MTLSNARPSVHRYISVQFVVEICLAELHGAYAAIGKQEFPLACK